MGTDYKQATGAIIERYDPSDPPASAEALQGLWLQGDARKVAALSAADREALQAKGISVSVLTEIGKTLGRTARKQVDAYLPLARLLWEQYGREGRIVAVHALGPMELAAPDKVMPVVVALARSCVAWEDCDQLSMRALEPIVRKDPEQRLAAMAPLLVDESKWVRRAAVTVVGRLPMKRPEYTARCLQMTEVLLPDEDRDVRRATSFAIRIAARGDVEAVVAFLQRHVPPHDAAATWVLCDAIRSMTKAFLPQFAPLLPLYEQWAADPSLSGQDLRSVENAVKVLRAAVNG